MKNQYILCLTLIFGVVSCSIGQECLMSPQYLTIRVPVLGFAWMDSDPDDDFCATVADSVWMKQPGDSFNLMVVADGPHGSGRYWTVTIGIASPDRNTPDRGICLQTSTVGWRTLQHFKNEPLPWLGDRDRDGQPEVIIWDSFPLHEDASMAEFGLMAWVYEINSKGILDINWPLSCQYAIEIAGVYRQPLSGSNERLQKRRNEIAGHLEKFASKKCSIYESKSH